jgi:tetratricopeptide (TPR) repeat protein
MLMAQDTSNYRRYIEVAQVYLKVGQEAEAARIVGTIIEPMLAGREESDLLELVNELLARDPEHVACLRLLARIHWWQRDMEKLRAALERLAEAAEAAGLVEDERYALTQLVRLVPDAQGYLDRLNLIGGFLEDSGEGTSMSDDPSLATVPSYEGFAIVGEPEPDLPAGETSEFEWNSVAEETPSHAAVSFADLNETEGQSEVSVLPDPVLADPLAQSADFAEGLGQTATDQFAGEAQGSPADIKVMMRQELESVDFYIAQGYSDIAFDTLELLERQFGSHPEIESRREILKTGKEDSKAEPLKSGPQPVGSGSALTAETDSPAVDLSFGDIEIEQTATVPTPAPVGSGIDSGLAEIFEEFRLEAEGESASSNEDFETHYNMATAYKEMDLLDEAIREFQIAAGLAGSVEAAPRFFQCCNMLGHCFVEKGMPRAAVLWFKKGLDAPGRNPEEYKALQYELGSAYEAMGDLTRAVAAFTEVYGVDVDYRDIAEKLESLQARTAAQKNKKKGK